MSYFKSYQRPIAVLRDVLGLNSTASPLTPPHNGVVVMDDRSRFLRYERLEEWHQQKPP
ncbi:hypothetical protein QJS10_CPB17g01909 [Acorus calamus]|uniref:Uncharacterized protein n=1 Tax=Acorus calamus TaxID=4465 RepID=A0AAV9CVU6_ACOCL|nr:hypothetical protein QJS10_CPB17g01909 [Acorus calamus]